MLKIFKDIRGNIRLADAAIAPMSAPTFIVFATKRRKMRGKTIFLEYFFFNDCSKATPS